MASNFDQGITTSHQRTLRNNARAAAAKLGHNNLARFRQMIYGGEGYASEAYCQTCGAHARVLHKTGLVEVFRWIDSKKLTGVACTTTNK